MQPSSRSTAADLLAVALCVVCTAFLGVDLWMSLHERGIGLLVFISPLPIAALLLLWRYRADVRRQPASFLAILFASPILFCIFPLATALEWLVEQLGMRPETSPGNWFVMFGWFGLSCFWWPMVGWCYRRSFRLFDGEAARTPTETV